MKWRLVACAVSVVLSGAVDVRAEPSSRSIAAEELFRAGRELLDQRRFKEACEKLDASEKLDPAVGTLISLGECYAGEGRSASAWFAYREATALATQRADPRLVATEARAAAIAPQLSTLEVHGGDDVLVTIDREPFTREQRGAPLPIDPGTHVVAASAPGFSSWSTVVEVRGTASVTSVEVPPLVDASAIAREQDRKATRRSIGIGVGALGLATVGAGALFGMQAIVKGRDANRACPGGSTCSDLAAVQENGVAKRDADISTVTIPIGAAVMALGTWLFLSARGSSIEVSARPSTAGGRMEVAWSW